MSEQGHNQAREVVSRRAFLAGAGAVMGIAAAGGLAGCSADAEDDADDDAEEEETTSAGFSTLPYKQFASGGVCTDLNAVILFERSNSTFTKYQVAYTSCTCRDAAVNYISVMYVELLNTKDTADEASIRTISFTTDDSYNVGVWGDSNPIYGQPTYTQEYMDEVFVQKLVGVSKAQVDAWEGYGTQLDVIDVDAVSGASVSTGNITSVLQSLFAYHADKYYAEEEEEA